MNVFNRVVVGILAILLLAIGLGLALFVVYYPFMPREIFMSVRDAAGGLATAQSFQISFVIAVLVLAVLLVIVGLGLLWWEVSPGGSGAVRLEGVHGATVVVGYDSIREGVRRTLAGFPFIRASQSQISRQGAAIDVGLSLRVAPVSNLPEKIEEITQRVREQLESGMGVRVRGIQAKVRIEGRQRFEDLPTPTVSERVSSVRPEPSASREPIRAPLGAPEDRPEVPTGVRPVSPSSPGEGRDEEPPREQRA
jgi:hypothetical protein